MVLQIFLRMDLSEIAHHLPKQAFEVLAKDIGTLRPAQEKVVRAGLFSGKNMLVCTPTASGKTLIAEFASVKTILEQHKMALYIVPLKALASEKFNDFTKRYGAFMQVALAVGDIDDAQPQLRDKDWLVCTAEKLDSLIRHHVPWLSRIGCVVVDEIHLLNDPGRGPTLEILITILRQLLPSTQIIGLSATIGNPEELAQWLDAELIVDDWRPVQLKKGTYTQGKLEFLKS